MIRALVSNIGWKLGALAAAAILWIAVNSEPELTTDLSVRVESKNVPDELEVSAGLPERVELEVRGPSGRLTAQNLASAVVILNFLGVDGPGLYSFEIAGRVVRLPAGVTLNRAVPSQVQLTFERRITREVKIAPSYARDPPPGYDIVRFRIDPPVAIVSGPESHVRALDSVETDPIDLSDAVGRVEFHPAAHVRDPQVKLESPKGLLTYRVVLRKNPLKDPAR